MDVISLYMTVPAQPAIDIISEHIIFKNLYLLLLVCDNICQLLSIIVDNTYFTYNGNTYKQISELPMGSSISGILAISYLDHLEHTEQHLSTHRAYSSQDIETTYLCWYHPVKKLLPYMRISKIQIDIFSLR